MLKLKKNFIIRDEDILILQKIYKLYVDVSFTENSIKIGNRLNAFLGQIGIYEGVDEFVKEIDKNLNLFIIDNFYEESELNEQKFFLDDSDKFISFLPSTFYIPVLFFFFRRTRQVKVFFLHNFSKKYFIRIFKLNLKDFFYFKLLSFNKKISSVNTIKSLQYYYYNLNLLKNYFFFYKKRQELSTFFSNNFY
jgi:hypothetical protein